MEYRILIRPTGELATKSRQTRRKFQRHMDAAIADALDSAGIAHTIHSEWGRVFVAASSRAALDVLPRVFGVVSVSEIEATAAARLEDIVEVGERLYAERVLGRRYAVRTRRIGSHNFSSKDIKRELGAALNRHGRVDLDAPDVNVGVEVRKDRVYFYSQKIRGPGGLPLGTEGSAVALLSGGFDSAVAAWMMLKRGIALDYVFCNLAAGAYERAVLSVAKLVADEWSYGTRPRIHVIDFEQPVRHLKERVRESFWQVILKRLMYRAGESVNREVGGHAIVTGESVGQVSSQTLANIAAIDRAVEAPVLRPLVGYDKDDIVKLSRRIGTYPLSEKVREYCAITEGRPVTEAEPKAVVAQEALLDLSILEAAVAERRVLDLRDLDASELVMPYLYTSEIPPDAVVIDARSSVQFEPWHYPGAARRDFWQLLRDPESLDRDRTYVLYCDLGLKTAQLAEKLQRLGYEAYSFKGGTRALKEYADRTGAGDVGGGV
jgi:thiamine biosynthesis protein ThiI